MITNFSDFIEHLIGARFSFKFLWDWLVTVYDWMVSNPEMQSIWSTVNDFISPIVTFLPYILIIAGFLVAFFGKKMGGLVKFLGFFFIGFVIGVQFLAPVIPPEVPIAPWIVGIVVAVVAAVMSKFLFVAVFSVLVLYSVYRVCYHGFFLDHQVEFSSGKALTALAVAAIILILALILFKFVEMLMFSLFGAWMVTSGFALGIIDLGNVPNLGSNSWILEVSVIGVIAILGFIVQVKTRRRY